MHCFFTVAILLPAVMLLTAGCSGGRQKSADESRQAKALMQGSWVSDDTEEMVFSVVGDTIYYADATTVPAYFRIVGDTLYVGTTVRYHVDRQTENIIWMTTEGGEQLKLSKNLQQVSDSVVKAERQQYRPLKEVIKKDTVVFLGGQRYHCYIAMNPTHYKVVKADVNDDGLMIEHVYYDNIAHISIFKGSDKLFSRDFRKQQYVGYVSREFLDYAILNDMTFVRCDEDGFHFVASLCVPDAPNSYLVDHIISIAGEVKLKLSEF